MSDTHIEEGANAPFDDPATFISLWNTMTVARRRNNIGLFRKALDRIPTEAEMEHGFVTECSDKPTNP